MITCFLQSIGAASRIIIGHVQLQSPLGLVSISLLAFQDKKLQRSHSSQGTGVTPQGEVQSF